MKYKTARQLRISQGAYDALKWFKNELRKGNVRHTTRLADDERTYTKLPFNMDVWGYMCEVPEKGKYCGSVHCIGGWMESYLGKFLGVKDKNRLHDLFYPYPIDDWRDIQPEVALKVIERFMKTGEIDWSRYAPKETDQDQAAL